ncbi:NAD(P)-binding Rossmann-fold superfamily protein [Phytophthora cinnamomi]|uniref:NAD(P)-binding Rossmann-fold superfamily protein n=1 Tax=Phytophthora cinnamomi TaxID=4785 RepID=UPI00355A1389|nr:NAD(P)-binding Rossmann-fold superfamily protein [Phytophthora cinnamomi]
MARVLVLGGTSYVAQFVLQRVLQDDALRVMNGEASEEISAVACTIRSEPFSPLPTGFVTLGSDSAARAVRVYWQVDILDLNALEICIKDFRPTVVINCTAISSPAICQKDPDKASSINEPRGLVTLLETLPWRVRFVHLSTDFVYEGGLAWGESYEEDAAVLSSKLSVYGASKLRFDQFLLEREHSASLEVLVLRIANVIGPVAPLFQDRSAPKFMQWLHRQLFQPEDADAPLKLWSDEFRSYLYIHDLVSVMFNLLAVKNNTPATLINLGGVEAFSRVELARQYLAACAKHDARTVTTVTREIVPIARAQIDLGYPSPLNTKLSTARLAHLLQDFQWTPTDQVLDEISRSLHMKS